MRRRMRERRRAVSEAERRAAGESVARHIARSLALRAGARIGIYHALPEELDTAPLARWARHRRLALYLPSIVDTRSRRMRFVLWSGATRRGRFGIEESAAGAPIDARWLDAVFLPLVAFDACGHRLGMGAGYYDRALAFRHQRRVWRGPRLVGIGYAFQEVPRIEALPHDVSLDAVATERGLRFFRGSSP